MKVLVVVDMQNDFIDGALGTPEAQAIVPKVVKKIEEFDGEVLWTQDTHSDDYLETQEGRLLPVEHCISASNGWQIHSSVKAAIQSKHPADDQLNGFEKKTFGSLALGQTQFVQANDGKVVVNMFAQSNYGYDGKLYTDYTAFQSCLKRIKLTVPAGETIAMPFKIGCGLGGGDWNVILGLIQKELSDKYTVELWRKEV